MDTMAEHDRLVTLGIDTHADVHVAAALDHLGRVQGTIVFETTVGGFNQLLEWAGNFGTIDRIGVESTGMWGAQLTRWLTAQGLVVIEVDRPDRKARRFKGKSDIQDAINAARAVMSGAATGLPKARDGIVEMIRVLKVARRTAVKARTQAANQLHALVVTAPTELHRQLRGMPLTQLLRIAVRFRPGVPTTPTAATKFAMRSLARRWQQLTDEIDTLDGQLERLVAEAAPELVEQFGVGTQTAAQLLVTAGDNPDRLSSEQAFAHLCGVAPLDASSGKRQQRHRYNWAGDRLANSALHMIAVSRLRGDERTRAYAARRKAEGKTKPEIFRCLKRYIARETYYILRRAPALQPS